MANVLRLWELKPDGIVKTSLNWQDAARLVRRYNRRAHARGQPDRYVVNSDSILCAVSRQDQIIWANDLFLRTFGYKSIETIPSAYNWIDERNHATMTRRMKQLGQVVTQPRNVRYLAHCVQGPVWLNIHTVDVGEWRGIMCRHFVASIAKEKEHEIPESYSVIVAATRRLLVANIPKEAADAFAKHFFRLTGILTERQKANP